VNILKLFGFRAQKSFANEIADTLGIDRRLYKTAMFEVGISTREINEMKKSGMSAYDVGIYSLPTLITGLNMLEKKFGKQALIEKTKSIIHTHAQNTNQI
jgi:hypothetical protein